MDPDENSNAAALADVAPGVASVVDEFGTTCFKAGIEVDPRGEYDPADDDLPDLAPFGPGEVLERVMEADGIDASDWGLGTGSISSELVRPDAPDRRSYLVVTVDDHGYPPHLVGLEMGSLRDRLVRFASSQDCWVRILSTDEVEEVHEAQEGFWEDVLDRLDEL